MPFVAIKRIGSVSGDGFELCVCVCIVTVVNIAIVVVGVTVVIQLYDFP